MTVQILCRHHDITIFDARRVLPESEDGYRGCRSELYPAKREEMN